MIIFPTVVSKYLSRKKGREYGKSGAGLSTRSRAQYMATAFRKPFRCLLMVQSSLQVWFVYFPYLAYTVSLIKFCDISLIKSLLAAKVLWGHKLKVDAAHSRRSAYSVKSLPFYCTDPLRVWLCNVYLLSNYVPQYVAKILQNPVCTYI